jgi:hypothetical protein
VGISTSPEQLARKLHGAGQRIKDENDRVLMEAARAGAASMQAAILAAVPSGRMRNVGKAGARIGAKAQSYGPGRAAVTATGPLAMLEGGTKPHDIRPKKGSRKRKGKGAIVINGSPRASAHHRGAKARPIWAVGETRALAAATEIQRTADIAILREVFR